MKKYLCLLICLLSISTVCLAEIDSPLVFVQSVYDQCKINTSEYNNAITIQAPSFRVNQMRDGKGRYSAIMIAVVISGVIDRYECHFYNTDVRFSFFDHASDTNADILNFNLVDRDVGYYADCEEHFYIKMNRAGFESIIKKGLDFKAYGKRENKIFKLPGVYIEGLLMMADDYVMCH